jgi:hypothetical protein
MNLSFHTCAVLILSAAAAAGQEVPLREIGRTTERELNIVLSSTFGTVLVSRGESGKMVVATTDGADAPRMGFEYDIRNRVGYLDLTLGDVQKEGEGRKRHLNLTDIEGGTWQLQFTDAIPISFDVELGVGKGDFDLSGLRVKDFNLSTGASDVALTFNTPNSAAIDNINIESGVSKFIGKNLGNANFRHFRFQGGVGTYSLDFGGTLDTEVDVDLEVGMGVMTIYVPKEVGARVFYVKSWVSRIDCDHDFVNAGENEYVTANFATAKGKMNIRVDTGFGSIAIRRR